MKVCKTCTLSLSIDSFEKNRNECKLCRRQKKKQKHALVCKSCGKEFRSARSNAEYCGHQCHGESRKKRVVVSCSNCGNDKQVVPSLFDRLELFYCNQDCRTEHLKTLMLGEKNPQYKRVNTNCSGCNTPINVQPFRVKNHKFQFCSYECYKTHIGNFFKGENNPLWNEELTAEDRIKRRLLPEYGAWRHSVYERDNYTCQCCGDSSGGNLQAHHINSWNAFPDSRLDVDNGIALCKGCHTSFHIQYGYGNNTKEQFKHFIYTQKFSALS